MFSKSYSHSTGGCARTRHGPPPSARAVAEAGGVLAQQRSFHFGQALGTQEFGSLWLAWREAKRADALIPTLTGPQRALYTPSSLLATSSLSGHRPCFGHYLTCRPNGQGPWGEKACALSHPIFLVPRTSSWCSKRLGGKAALLNFEAFPASWVPRFTGYKERFSPSCLV